MKIIIVGCGKVGQTLAYQLNEEDNDITVIDLSPEKVNETSAKCDVMGVVGNGATHAVQQEAGIDKADLLIAVTGSDELNLLCCLIAKKAGNCKTIARIKDTEYSMEAPYLKDELGLAMVINPEAAAADEIARILRFPSALKIDTFAKGRAELIKFKLPDSSMLVNMSVKEMAMKLRCDVLVCTIERDTKAFIANGDFVFQARDIVSVIASPENAAVFFDKIGYKSRSVKDVIIAGGGEITRYLCDNLRKTHIRAKIIEKNPEVCEELAARYSDVSIICGDATDQDLLLEEGLSQIGAFVALTNFDEENVLLSLFAKSVGSCITMTKINRIDFDDVIKHLDLDATIYPKNITSDIIVRYVRSMKNTMGSNVENFYNLIKGKVEASEFVIKSESKITGMPLSELRFKDNILVAAILRAGKVIIPRGNHKILVGDSVVIISEMRALNDITDVLA